MNEIERKYNHARSGRNKINYSLKLLSEVENDLRQAGLMEQSKKAEELYREYYILQSKIESEMNEMLRLINNIN